MTWNNLLGYQYSIRNKKIKEIGFNSYKEYLSSPYWKELNTEFKKRQAYSEHWRTCHCCSSTTKRLILHHLKYGKIKKVILSGVVPICMDCHHAVHEYHKKHPHISIRQATRRHKRYGAKQAQLWN